jgi:hypothetical protein
MGIFDYIRCHYPLPITGANELEFQTKDTNAQYCDHYEIRADGTLWHQVYETEDRSDPNAEGLFRLIGCQTRVNDRWEPDAMTGEVRFYTDRGDDWIEFSAYFVHGTLKHLHTISGEPS